MLQRCRRPEAASRTARSSTEDMLRPPQPSSPAALDLRVLELLVSRLCHDMVSPIGAVNNGIELMEEMGDEMGDQAIELVAHSGRQAAARLQCFQIGRAQV